MNTKTLDEVRELFKNDRFAMKSGAVIDEIGEHYAKCSLEVSDSHRNALGAVMGGIKGRGDFYIGRFCFCCGGQLAGTGGGFFEF